jgi:hypothetical protein
MLFALVHCGDSHPTYYKNVEPLMAKKCVGCHTDGGIAPFALTSFDDAFENRSQIQTAVEDRIMPPWMPAKDCAEYKNDFSLSDDEIDTISKWVDDGAPAGDPADSTHPEPAESELAEVDVELSMPESYTPQIDPDDYRCFPIEWPESSTKYVIGFHVRPGETQIVHHVIAYLIPPGFDSDIATLEAEDATPGYTCFGGPRVGDVISWLGTWVPGAGAVNLPTGLGQKVEPGSTVVLQVHYNTENGTDLEDLTTMKLDLSNNVEKEAVVVPFTNPNWIDSDTMEIPAGAEDMEHAYSIDPSPFLSILTGGVLQSFQPVTIYTAGLHMHVRGSHAKLEIQREGGGNECLLDIPDWDFHWQSSYEFAEPIEFQPGDQLSIECHWDNSDNDETLYWGEGTSDEMCLGAFLVAQ